MSEESEVKIKKKKEKNIIKKDKKVLYLKFYILLQK